MSLVRRCVECDAAECDPHDDGCSFAEPPYTFTRTVNFMSQAAEAERYMNEILAAARAAGHIVVGDTVIVRDANKGTV